MLFIPPILLPNSEKAIKRISFLLKKLLSLHPEFYKNTAWLLPFKKVSSKKELKTFIRFNYELYKENPYSVPDLYDDMLNTFSPKKNAAFEFCEAVYFLAYKDDKVVGRIAGIINHRANETWQKKEVRFGWIDFLDDIEISRALLDAVSEWGKSKGMDTIQGPLGFTDFDAEGMLIEGFDQLSTMALLLINSLLYLATRNTLKW